jgi:hypothetical protein
MNATQYTIISWSSRIRRNETLRKISTILAASTRVERKNDERNRLNLALIAKVEERLLVGDVDVITVRNNITDLCTLKILHDIAKSKNMKINLFAPKVHSFQESQLQVVVPPTTSTWDDSE